jgi:hypothetical protein
LDFWIRHVFFDKLHFEIISIIPNDWDDNMDDEVVVSFLLNDKENGDDKKGDGK